MRLIALTALLLATAACGRDEPAAETRRTANAAPEQAKGEAPGTTFAARADAKTGAVEIALPGARLSLDLPLTEAMSASEFDIDGTKLYPGSTIERMDVKAFAAPEGKDDNARVNIDFTAPAAPDVVRAWFLSATAAKDHPLRAAADGLVGATKDGKSYRIDLNPADGGRTAGRIAFEG